MRRRLLVGPHRRTLADPQRPMPTPPASRRPA